MGGRDGERVRRRGRPDADRLQWWRSDTAFAVSCHPPLQLMISALLCVSTCAMRISVFSMRDFVHRLGVAIVINLVIASLRSISVGSNIVTPC